MNQAFLVLLPAPNSVVLLGGVKLHRFGPPDIVKPADGAERTAPVARPAGRSRTIRPCNPD
jgi:hypothetical protein